MARSTKKPSTKRPSTKKLSTKRPSTKKPSTKKPSTKKPSTKRPSTKKPSTKTKKPSKKRTKKHNKNVKKGGAVRMPSEYFGKDSRRYSVNHPASYMTKHGMSRGVSHGTLNADGTAGPNLAFVSTSKQSGAGCGCGRK